MKLKLTDEQISRVLSEHSIGGLERFGGFSYSTKHPCLMGVANCRFCEGADIRGYSKGKGLAYQFDSDYEPDWSTEQFISWLGKQGVL